MSLRAWHVFILLMAHPNMPPYWATSYAQSDAMTLISLAPPTSVAPTTTVAVAAAAATTTAAANTDAVATTISYPSGEPTINYEDTVLVSYNTPWNSAKLSLYCQDGSSWVSYDANNVPSSGIYNLSPVEGSLDLSKYPSLCHIHLSDAGNSANAIDGGDFTLVSTRGAVKTFGASTTVTAATGSAASISGSRIGTQTTSSGGSRSTSAAGTSSVLESAAGAASTSTTSLSSSSHSGLSGGAKAGIVIAVLLIVGLLVLAAFLYRRQRQKHSQQLHAVQSELATERAARASEKAYLDSILNAAGKPDTEHGGKIRVADDVRASGDWRRFFGSKAASAAGSVAGAAAAVGAAISNSRPGSRRASMAKSTLGQGEEVQKDLPPVPAIPRKPVPASSPTVTALPPSPTVSDSVNGGGGASEMGETRSTTALIPPGKR